jgi:hypothetical protein
MQYGAGATTQGCSAALGRVTLAFAVGCPITTAATSSNTEAAPAINGVRFMTQN